MEQRRLMRVAGVAVGIAAMVTPLAALAADSLTLGATTSLDALYAQLAALQQQIMAKLASSSVTTSYLNGGNCPALALQCPAGQHDLVSASCVHLCVPDSFGTTTAGTYGNYGTFTTAGWATSTGLLASSTDLWRAITNGSSQGYGITGGSVIWDAFGGGSPYGVCPATAMQCPLGQLDQVDASCNHTCVDVAAKLKKAAATLICPVVDRLLSVGSQGSDVFSLQQYLNGQGYLSVDPTGYYGPLTQSAVQSFQADQGIVSVGSPATTGFGVFGPLTRAWFNTNCSTSSTATASSTPVSLIAAPSSGQAPLAVGFAAYGLTPNSSYIFVYGDGTNSGELIANGGTFVATHVYTAAGGYTASLDPYLACLWSATPTCTTSVQPVAQTNITVGGSGAACIAPPDGKTYQNGESATYSDWCAPGSAAVYCGSGTKTCRNGLWQ